MMFVAIICFGQKRTYIKRDHVGHENIFVTENPENGERVIYIQVGNFGEAKDSVFFVLDEPDSKALQDYCLGLLRIYEKWSALAKSNRIADFQKEIDIPAPALNLMWRTRRSSQSGWGMITSPPHYAIRTAPTSAVFRVYKNGASSIRIYYDLTTNGGETYKVTYWVLGDIEIRRMIGATNWKSMMRKYQRLQPKKTTEEFDALLEKEGGH